MQSNLREPVADLFSGTGKAPEALGHNKLFPLEVRLVGPQRRGVVINGQKARAYSNADRLKRESPKRQRPIMDSQ